MFPTAPGTSADAPEPLVVAGPRLGRGRALAEVLLCSGYVTQLAVAGVLGLAGLRPVDPSGRLSPPFVFLLSFGDAVLLVGLILWLLRLGGERPRDVLFGRGPWRRDVLFGIALTPLVLAVVAVLLVTLRAVAPWLHNVEQNPLGDMLRSPLQVAIFAVVVLVAGAVREEVQRAFLLHRFARHLGGPVVGLVVTSLAFGLGHSIQGWDAMIATGALGAAWGAIYLARRSAAAPMTSHALFNLSELARGVATGQL